MELSILSIKVDIALLLSERLGKSFQNWNQTASIFDIQQAIRTIAHSGWRAECMPLTVNGKRIKKALVMLPPESWGKFKPTGVLRIE